MYQVGKANTTAASLAMTPTPTRIDIARWATKRYLRPGPMGEHRRCRCVKGLRTTALPMPPISEKGADMTMGGAGFMAQPTPSGLPRYMVTSKPGVPENIGRKRMVLGESGDGGPGNASGGYKGAPGKRGMSGQPSPTCARRQDRGLGALRCTGRCI